MSLEGMIFLTNLALDEFNHEDVREAGLPMGEWEDGHESVLIQAEWNFLGEGGYEIPGIAAADISLAHAVLYKGAKYVCAAIEFHFRNDATRHMWGTPVTYETNLPDRAFQSQQLQWVFQRARVIESVGGFVTATHDTLTTKDRHTLYILIPFGWLLREPGEHVKEAIATNHTELLAFMRGLLLGSGMKTNEEKDGD